MGITTVEYTCTLGIWAMAWGKSFLRQGTLNLPLLCWSHCSNAVLLCLCQPCRWICLHRAWSSCPWLGCGCDVDCPFVANNWQRGFWWVKNVLAARAWRIFSCVMTDIVFVPFCPVLLQPCAIPPKSLPNAVCHTSAVSGSCISFLQLEIILPGMGCTMGLAKCSTLIGIGVAQFVINLRGVWMVHIDTCSWMVRMFIPCCITILCQALVVIWVYIVGRGAGCMGVRVEHWRSHGDSIGWCGSMTVVTGDMPRELLQVTRLCRHGVAFRARVAVGCLDCMMAGALVSWGMVMIGVASITLCSASRALCLLTSATLCSIKGGGRAINWSIRLLRSRVITYLW